MAQQPQQRVVIKASGSYAEVRQNLEDAIINQGLVVSAVSHLGEMLKRTGRDLGLTTDIYGQAEVIEFCSAVLTRRMVETDPHALVNCPFRIAVYTLATEPNAVHLAYTLPVGRGDQGAYAAIAELFRTLADAAQW